MTGIARRGNPPREFQQNNTTDGNVSSRRSMGNKFVQSDRRSFKKYIRSLPGQPNARGHCWPKQILGQGIFGSGVSCGSPEGWGGGGEGPGHARIWPNRIWPELVFQSVDRIWPNRVWPILVF